MLVMDGTTVGGSQRFWRAGSTGGGVCGLTIGKTYFFTYWVKSVSNTVTNPATSANLGVFFNNVSSSTLVSGNALAPLPAAGWQKVVYSFVPNNPCVIIELFNSNFSLTGNDFALDDLSVTTTFKVTASATGLSCTASNNGTITAYVSGGLPPFSYTLVGSTTQTNLTGFFTGLTNGAYTLTVTDFNGSITPSIPPVNVTNVTALGGSLDSAICSGGNQNLIVAGLSTAYTWTSSPTGAVITNNNVNGSSVSVSPIVTTTYTATTPNYRSEERRVGKEC